MLASPSGAGRGPGWHDALVHDDQPTDRLGLPAIAWAIYDFGYSLFAFVLFARYLSDWLISDLGHPDWVYTSGQAVAALSLLLIMPFAGVAADVIGKHRPLLALFTATAAIAGGLVGVISPDIGALGVLPLLMLGTISAASTGLAFAQFDPMLASVAPRRSWNVMSGVAVAAGYLGIIVWLLLLADPIVGEGDKQAAFLPAAVLFALLSLPVLLFAHEPPRTEPRDVNGARGIWRAARTEQRGALTRLRGERPVVRLLLGRLLYADAVGTVNVFAVVYMSRLGGFSESDKNNVTLLVVLCAGVGALLAGALARRVGPRKTLMGIIPIFAAGIVGTALAGEPWTVWVLAPVLGVSLGTVYTVDRVFLLALTPPELRGEIFGFFNLIGRVAQALGPFILWGGVIFVLHDLTGWLNALDASRVSLVLISIAALCGLLVIRPLDDQHAATLQAQGGGGGDAADEPALAASSSD
ncbi:MAG: major facilitator superfamily 1 [Thermoleophilia bacterium]|nr:major facilitator superfamily 1 [Thermoleophilia bacterium]